MIKYATRWYVVDFWLFKFKLSAMAFALKLANLRWRKIDLWTSSSSCTPFVWPPFHNGIVWSVRWMEVILGEFYCRFSKILPNTWVSQFQPSKRFTRKFTWTFADSPQQWLAIFCLRARQYWNRRCHAHGMYIDKNKKSYQITIKINSKISYVILLTKTNE